MSDYAAMASAAQAPGRATTGRLDGLTILRFARAFEEGGGVEGHLADLNGILGSRNRITTVQMQLTADPLRVAPTERRDSSSRMVTVPLLVRGSGPGLPGPRAGSSAWLFNAKNAALACLLPTHRLNMLAMRHLSPLRVIPRRGGEAEGAGATAARLLRQFDVDLVVLHACEGSDTAAIIEVAAEARVPVAIVHHFSNHRLGTFSVRQQVIHAAGVGGASSVGVPRYLRGMFQNLSDAVDTEFYSRGRARPIQPEIPAPYIFAPGRVTPEKGQVDVLEVTHRLRQRGLRVHVVFAGRSDNPAFEARLHALVAERGLDDAVTFVGGLTLHEYRDWYSGACVMLMPTRHDEGMPRTLIESQAMEVPPVVYDIGGTSEGVRNGETGFVVPRGDVDGMADAVEWLIRHPDARHTMATAGRRFVQSAFSLSALAERHEQFYAEVLGRGARP